MFTDEDIDFHIPDNMPAAWAETNMFVFSVPEKSIVGHVHMVTRKAVGITQAEVVVFGDLSTEHTDVLYADNQPSMPAITSLSSARTLNGLKVDALNIRDYDVQYDGAYGDMAFALEYRGLMDPYDPHDPSHNPLMRAEGGNDIVWSESYKGHLDLTCRVKGTLKLYGREFEVDCVEAMDHSWGPRHEIGAPAGGWMHAHFGEGLAISWINRRDIDHRGTDPNALAYGYVLKDSEVTGLVSLSLRVIRIGWLITGIIAVAKDAKGRTFELQGTAVSGGPVRQYNHVEVCHALIRWALHDGTIGYGMVVEGMSVQAGAERSARRWTPIS
jgi:hypothetical protein